MKIWFYQKSSSRSNQHRGRFRKLTFRELALYHCKGRSRSDEELTLKTSAFQIFHSGNLIFINSFHKTEFSSYCSLLSHLAVSLILEFTASFLLFNLFQIITHSFVVVVLFVCLFFSHFLYC